jgi:nucleotide-binding universal stress UspA family protein
MANLFVLNLAGTVAPVAADKNANRLIAAAVAALAPADGDVPSAPEPIDVDARRAALFGEVTAGAMSMDDAVAALKALDAEVAAAAKAAKADPPVLLVAGEPSTAAEIKRAFRGQDDGTSIVVASLDGERVGAITMFRV